MSNDFDLKKEKIVGTPGYQIRQSTVNCDYHFSQNTLQIEENHA